MEGRMITRLVKKTDLKELKEIWKLSFGDEDEFIDFYFQGRAWMRETAVLHADGRVVSMLTMIPVDMIGKGGEKCRAAMLYAIATHPDFRKLGLADRLIEFSNRSLLAEQVPVTLLVPASEDLFRFYGKRGYQEGFFVHEAVLLREEIERLAGAVTCRVAPAEPAEYNRRRRERLRGHPYLDYRDEEISFEKQLGRLYGTDIYTIDTGGVEGCVYAERRSQEEVIVKELLIPDQYLIAALKQITELLPGEKYIVRTPSWSGAILGGAVRPFGMLRINRNENEPFGGADCRTFDTAAYTAGTGAWLGIAFD